MAVSLNRVVVSNNHFTIAGAYKHLKVIHPCSMRHNAIANLERYIYLLFIEVHLPKNIRNNLLSTKFFKMPSLETTLVDVSINTLSSHKYLYNQNIATCATSGSWQKHDVTTLT